jgi:hypothetical protein
MNLSVSQFGRLLKSTGKTPNARRKTMIFPARLFLLMILSLSTVTSTMSVQAQSATVETELDRSEITRGETVTLRIRVYGQQGGVAVDLEPLRDRFEIVSTRSTSQLRSVNNRVESWTDYNLVLFPRELGEQQIPSISVAGTQTQPYTITVTESVSSGLAAGQDVYMETIINADSVYVQEQLLFTIRLYYTIAGIRNPNFTEVEPENALVQLLGAPHQYEQLIDGQRYGVYEKNYVIFPQRSGELTIPNIVFRGELTDGSSNFVFRNPNMRPVTAFAPGYQITVKERPAAFPQDHTWLPASDVQINETWSTDITQLRPGDSVERTLTITADGLDGAALPPLRRQEIQRMNVYPESPKIERLVYDGRVIGTRIEKYTLVATSDGSVVIPEITLPWWDVNSDTLRYATVPASFIRIAADGSAISPDPLSAAADATDSSDRSLLSDELISGRRTPAWALNITALAILVILSAMWWLWRRRLNTMAESVKTIERTAAYQREIEDGQEKHAFADLENSINKSDPQQIRLHMIAWGRQYYSDPGLHNLDDLGARLQNKELLQLCQALQAALYGGESSHHAFGTTERQALLRTLRQLRKSRQQASTRAQQEQAYALPPLYRS